METERNSKLSPGIIFLMSAGAGCAVANNYYNQPLLPVIAHSFSTNLKIVGLVAGATQIGYAMGLFFISPIGDRVERKKLMRVLFVTLFFSLIMAGFAVNIWMLVIASLIIGISATVVQQIIPFAAALAEPERRGETVGMVMTGMTLGILLARTLSGTIDHYFGWRSVFLIAAFIVLIISLLLINKLPKSKPTTSLSYNHLLTSMLFLFKSERILREAAFVGALWFACFGAFWATLAIHVSNPPYNYNSQIAGLFGLLGIAGVTATRISGRLADKFGSRPIILGQLALMVSGILIMVLSQDSLVSLILGTVILDYGVFGAQVANQARIFSLQPDARSRVNAIYMVCYYSGGALGSLTGTLAWQWARWDGVGCLCLLFLMIAMAIHVFSGFRKNSVDNQKEV